MCGTRLVFALIILCFILFVITYLEYIECGCDCVLCVYSTWIISLVRWDQVWFVKAGWAAGRRNSWRLIFQSLFIFIFLFFYFIPVVVKGERIYTYVHENEPTLKVYSAKKRWRGFQSGTRLKILRIDFICLFRFVLSVSCNFSKPPRNI